MADVSKNLVFFNKGIKKYFTSIKGYIVDVHAKFALEWESLNDWS